MTRRIRPTRSIPLLAALALCGCESLFNDFSVIPPEEIPRTPAIIDATDRLARAPAGDPQIVDLLTDAPRSSAHLVRVTGKFAPHLHRHADETVYVLEGEGDFLVDREWKRVKAGTLVHIPMNVPHGFVNRAAGGTLLLSEFTPPYVAGDRIQLQEERR